LKRAPENTIAAFQAAIKAGVRAIELDVVQTKDKEIVCSHNFDLERKTNDFGYIFNKTWAELRAINVVSQKESNPTSMPRLKDVLEHLPDYCNVNIEIKTHKLFDVSTAIGVTKIIQQSNRCDTITVSSFNPRTLRIVKTIEPKIDTGFLIKKSQLTPLVLFSRADNLHPRADVFSNQMWDYCKRHLLSVNIWTVNTKPGAVFLHKRNVNGIITDYPKIATISI